MSRNLGFLGTIGRKVQVALTGPTSVPIIVEVVPEVVVPVSEPTPEVVAPLPEPEPEVVPVPEVVAEVSAELEPEVVEQESQLSSE